jgi:CxxC-x17-CxxC domain-containing protein
LLYIDYTWEFLIFKLNQTIKSDFNTYQKRKFETKCDKCGQKATVPFKPIFGRKVFCKDCYSKQQSHNPREATNHSFNTNIAWARRTKKFSGRREKKPTSIFHK